MSSSADRPRLTFRASAISFGALTLLVALLATALLILLDPRSQAFWGLKLSGLGTAARAFVDQLPRLR